MTSTVERYGTGLLLGWLLACAGAGQPGDEEADVAGWPVFTDVAAEAGLRVPVQSGSQVKADILEVNTGGVAIFDYDGDGDRDLFFVNGGAASGSEAAAPRSLLYRNDGDWHFTDVTQAAGVSYRGWGMGVAVWDVDGDGWPDLYLSAWGPNLLYRNRGDGTFEAVPGAGGAGDTGWSTGIAAADYDLDGDVDFYLSRYLERGADTPLAVEPPCLWRGIEAFCGPVGLPPAADRLYSRQAQAAGGFFVDVTAAAAVADRPAAYGLGAIAGDLDADGDADLYVANDATPNFLFRNRSRGRRLDGWRHRLQETGVQAGAATSADGRNQAGMGVAAGDVDGDGRLDLVVSNFSHDHVALYVQDPVPLTFHEAAFASDLGRRTLATLGWGVGLVDFDHDLDLDLFIANGHVYPQVDGAGIGTSYRQRNQIFRNEEGFLRAFGASSGTALRIEAASRGAAFGDLDDDGDIDVVVVNLGEPPSLLRHEGVAAGWLTVELAGPAANRSAIGARVRLRVPGAGQVDREVRAGTGYLSQDDHRLHFGTGTARSVEVEIRWPDGARSTLSDVPVRNHLRVSYDEAVSAAPR